MKSTAVGALMVLSAIGIAWGAYLKLPEGQIPLHSAVGIKLLEESDARANFYHLMQHLSWQQTLSTCGVATAVTVLNTMQLANAPLCETLDKEYPHFDQSNFFSTEVEKVVPPNVVAKIGFTLEQWAAAMASYGVKAEPFQCGLGDGEIGFEAFIAGAKAVLKSPNQYLFVNFQRKALGQVGVGHFCPVGAYNEKENKLLILEVAIFEYPVFWVDAKLLWNAMDTRDNISQKNRGFVVLTTKPESVTEKNTQSSEAEIIPLPAPQYDSRISVEKAISLRRSIRDYVDVPLSISEISQILWAAQGFTRERKEPPRMWNPKYEWQGGLRTAPSAGALYPMEIYLLAGNVGGLAKGVYKFIPKSHSLKRMMSVDKRTELGNAALKQASIEKAAAVIVMAGVYERTSFKYGERTERYVHIEVGSIAENVYLQAMTLGIGTVIIGAFNDKEVKSVLQLAEDEHPLAIMPLGKIPRAAEQK